MKQSEIFLEREAVENPNFVKVISIEKAKTYGKIVELEERVIHMMYDEYGNTIESVIEKLMKS